MAWLLTRHDDDEGNAEEFDPADEWSADEWPHGGVWSRDDDGVGRCREHRLTPEEHAR